MLRSPGLIRLLSSVMVLGLLSACGSGGDNAPALASIEVTPNTAGGAAGTSTQLAATGIYSDGSHKTITSQVAWSSSNTAIATISSGGLASAVAPGSATLSAALQGVTGTASFAVTGAFLVSIEVSTTKPTIAKGLTAQFVATGIFSDNSKHDLTTQVSWSATSSAVASVNSTGLVTGAGIGSTMISASSGASTGTATLAVTPAILISIVLSPAAPSIAKGVVQQFTATGVFSDQSLEDLTDQVTWSSSNGAAATVGNGEAATVGGAAVTAGVAKTAGVGSTTIVATLGSVSGNTLLTVTPATLVSIQVTPPNPSIAKGLKQQFAATGIYTDQTTHDLTATATWSSGATTIATISNATGTSGLASAVGMGSTNVKASLGAVSGSAQFTVTPAVLVSIQVTPVNPTVPKGLTTQLTANGIYTDQSMQNLTAVASWLPADATVATVSNGPGQEGIATAVGLSTTSTSTTITATYNGVSGTTELTVGPAALESIAVSPSPASTPSGTTQQFTATGTFSDKTTQTLTSTVTWSSSDLTVATFSASGPHGLATALLTGTATTSNITASSNGVTSPPVVLSVTPAVLVSIAITPVSPQVPNGLTQQFSAMGTFTGNLTRDITSQVSWISSDPTVATFSTTQLGLATALKTGSATAASITASMNGIVSNQATLTITAATLSYILVTPDPASVPNGESIQFTATGYFSDTTHHDITNQSTFASSDTTVATFSTTNPATNPASGLATALLTGTATTTQITATSGGKTSAPVTLTVTAAVLKALAICPANGSSPPSCPASSPVTLVGVGVPQQYQAVGTYTAGPARDETANPKLTWSTTDPSGATVTSISGGGLVTLQSPSPLSTAASPAPLASSVGASLGGFSASSSLTVDASFSTGTSETIYALLSTSSTAKNGTSYQCSGCHTAGPGAIFYVAGGTTTAIDSTLGKVQGLGAKMGISGNFYQAACVASPDPVTSTNPNGMPLFAGSSFCTILEEWIAEGGTN